MKPHAIDVRVAIDPVHWFLHSKDDTQSSYYLEDVATEFQVQGVELDWVGVVWDANLRYSKDGWRHHSFEGTRWQNVKAFDRKRYLENAYRVLLTRARQGMVIVVPEGDIEDPTRTEDLYDPTCKHRKTPGKGKKRKWAANVAHLHSLRCRLLEHSHHFSKNRDPSRQPKWRQGVRTIAHSELDRRIVVWDFRQQVADSIDVMESGNNPLIIAHPGFHDSPDAHRVECLHQRQVFPESIKSISAPNVIIRQRVPERAEIFVENILMKDSTLLHSDIPMRRQRFVPKSDFFKALDQV